MFHLPLIVHIITRFALLFRDFSLHFRKDAHLYYSILHSIFHSIFLFFIIMTKSIPKLAFSTVNQAIRKQKKEHPQARYTAFVPRSRLRMLDCFIFLGNGSYRLSSMRISSTASRSFMRPLLTASSASTHRRIHVFSVSI